MDAEFISYPLLRSSSTLSTNRKLHGCRSMGKNSASVGNAYLGTRLIRLAAWLRVRVLVGRAQWCEKHCARLCVRACAFRPWYQQKYAKV